MLLVYLNLHKYIIHVYQMVHFSTYMFIRVHVHHKHKKLDQYIKCTL